VRIDAEADLMIALEALKNDVTELRESLQRVETNIYHQTRSIQTNTVHLRENDSDITQSSAAV